MNFIKIFLASSIVEFEAERYAIGNFIRILNNRFIRDNTYIELILCENLSNAMAQKRKQEEYNQQIRESQYVCILCGKSMGEYTKEEFKVAKTQFQKTGNPQIGVFFFKSPKQESIEQSVTDFMEYLDTNTYSYQKVQHVDEIKYQLLKEIIQICDKDEVLRTEEDKVMLYERAVLTLENISKNGRN